jgi:hypothetical protein
MAQRPPLRKLLSAGQRTGKHYHLQYYAAKRVDLGSEDLLFPSELHDSPQRARRNCARS